MSFMYNCFASNQSVTDGQKCLFFPIRKENGFHTVSLLDNDNKEYIVNNNTKFGSGYNAFWDFLSIPYVEGHYYEDEGFVLDDNETNRIAVINFLDYLYDCSLISKEGGFYCLNSNSNLNSKEIIDLFFDFFDKNPKATSFDKFFIDKFLENEFIKKLSGFMNDNNITLSPSVILTRYYDNSSGKEFAKFVNGVNKEINKNKVKKGML